MAQPPIHPGEILAEELEELQVNEPKAKALGLYPWRYYPVG